MKKRMNFFISGIILVSASCIDKKDEIADLNAPIISFAEGKDTFRPENGEIIEASSDHVQIQFSVTDDSGIGQVLVDIHSSFDGHSHGRILTDFERMSVKDIYSPDASNSAFRFPEGSRYLNVDDNETNIFWDGSKSRVEGNILAGPYDLVISAVDEHGNQTSFADDSNYFATFYIQRPYAPLIEVSNLEDGELHGAPNHSLTITGSISKGSHALSSVIKFVWIKLEEEHEEHNHGARIKELLYEKMWGTSTWIEGATGTVLPNTQNVKLEDLLTGENAIVLPAGEDFAELFIWVEDVNGNITEESFEVHIE